MTVPSLLQRVSARELSEWMAYDAVEGLPDRRVELLLAQLLALTANVHRDPKAELLEARQFLPWLADDDDAENEVPQPTMLLHTVERLNALLGGADLRES